MALISFLFSPSKNSQALDTNMSKKYKIVRVVLAAGSRENLEHVIDSTSINFAWHLDNGAPYSKSFSLRGLDVPAEVLEFETLFDLAPIVIPKEVVRARISIILGVLAPLRTILVELEDFT